MQITIDNPETLLQFIKKDNISARAAVDIFEAAFCVVAIIFIDAISREPHLVKDKVIEKIEDFINNRKNGRFDKVVIFS